MESPVMAQKTGEIRGSLGVGTIKTDSAPILESRIKAEYFEGWLFGPIEARGKDRLLPQCRCFSLDEMASV